MARILLVDDEIHILTVLSMLFKSRGDEVETAHGGDAAIVLLKSHDFDLMVSDMRMKPISGLDVLKSAKQLRPEMPVIMVTAYDTVETAREALALGAAAYLRKPFDNDELLSIADDSLGGGKAGSG